MYCPQLKSSYRPCLMPLVITMMANKNTTLVYMWIRIEKTQMSSYMGSSDYVILSHTFLNIFQ